MTKIINGEKELLEELQANVFARISEEGTEIRTDEQTKVTALKIDMDLFNDNQLKVIEAAMFSRINSGVLNADMWEVNEQIIQSTFSLTADSQEKYEIVMNDILRGAKVPEDKIVVLTQPWAPKMYNTQIYCIIAFDLSSDQMKAIELSTKLAKGGIKVTNIAKKVGMVGTATGNVVNRVSREVVLAGTEIGATVAAGTVKTGVEALAVATNIAIRDLNPKELIAGSNVQTLIGTVKGLWSKRNSDSKVTTGFGSL